MFKGVFLLVSGELCFALATVFAKFVTNSSSIPAVEITFFRFILGALLAFVCLVHWKASFRAARWDLVFWRGLLNTLAVLLFFMSVQHTTLTNANMLNMTYPAFLFLVAPFINNEKSSPPMFLFLALTMVGITLVVRPDFSHVRMGDFYGLLSGIIGAFGVATLRKARKFDSASLILFYQMAFGTLLNFAVMVPVYQAPQGRLLVPILISALLGVFGQAFMISGYLHISARSGGLVSSSRIVVSTALGVILFHEALTPGIVLGGLCILGSVVGVTLLMRAEPKETKPAPAAKELAA